VPVPSCHLQDGIHREGAQRLSAQAIEAEVGKITSAILPPYLRKTKSIENPNPFHYHNRNGVPQFAW